MRELARSRTTPQEIETVVPEADVLGIYLVCLPGNLKRADKTLPPRISPPTRMIPREKDPASAAIPMSVGIAPPPRRKEKGTVRETATLRTEGADVNERAAKPGGKKHAAMRG
jgi:hypothetical protein